MSGQLRGPGDPVDVGEGRMGSWDGPTLSAGGVRTLLGGGCLRSPGEACQEVGRAEQRSGLGSASAGPGAPPCNF